MGGRTQKEQKVFEAEEKERVAKEKKNEIAGSKLQAEATKRKEKVAKENKRMEVAEETGDAQAKRVEDTKLKEKHEKLDSAKAKERMAQSAEGAAKSKAENVKKERI